MNPTVIESDTLQVLFQVAVPVFTNKPVSSIYNNTLILWSFGITESHKFGSCQNSPKVASDL
jgi:hypothetical protein